MKTLIWKNVNIYECEHCACYI